MKEMLKDNELHIWCIPYLQACKSKMIVESVLSPDELIQASQFKFKELQQKFLLRRTILRKILGRYCGSSPKKLNFCTTSYGKPYITGDINISFNFSHSNELAYVAITNDLPVGIDVELIEEFDSKEKVAKQFFSPKEYTEYTNLEPHKKLEAFFDIWTRKEAFIKAIGEGLSYPLDQFQVTFKNRSDTKINYTATTQQGMPEWKLLGKKILFNNLSYIVSCAYVNSISDINFYEYEA